MGGEYSDRKQHDEELQRQFEIKNFEKMLEELPPEKLKEPFLVAGDRTFTLEEMLDEVRKGTSFGIQFLKTQSRSRIERTRRQS